MRILAVDPGNVTGTAYYDTVWPDAPITSEIGGGLYGFVDWWWDSMAAPFTVDHVVVEDWIVRPDTHRKTRQPAAYETLGWVKGKCHEQGIHCSVVGPSEHTPFSDYKVKKRSKIVRLGWSSPSKDMHADSAQSVLLYAMLSLDRDRATELLKEIAQ